jgi:hypothetical protein
VQVLFVLFAKRSVLYCCLLFCFELFCLLRCIGSRSGAAFFSFYFQLAYCCVLFCILFYFIVLYYIVLFFCVF